ncbi:MAG TPA: hypothetical protein VI039_00635 [Solirubrobacterales bacterium]
MLSGCRNIWKRVQELAVVLVLLGLFAPFPDSIDSIVTGLALVLLLAYYVVTWREERREREADQSSRAAISSSDKM